MSDKSKKGKKVRSKDSSGLDSRWVAKNLPYVFFLILLAMVYIANAHYTQKKIRKIDQLKSEIKELNWSYMTVKSELIYQGTYTQLSDDVRLNKLSNEGNFPQKLDLPKSKSR